MGIQHLFGNEPFWDWRRSVTKTLQIHDTDIMRIWRRLGQTPDPVGAPPAGSGPWTPAPGSGGNGRVLEGFLAGTLAASDATGATAGTATLDLWAVVSGTWQATGDTITVTNRSYHLWLPSGYPVQCVNLNGEYRPTIQYSPPFKGILTSSLSAGGSATATVAGVSVTVSPALDLGATTIASGKGVWVNFTSGTFRAVEAEC